MKILMVNPVGFIGGAERCLLTAIRGLVSMGHEVTLIPCTNGPLLTEAENLGARIHPLPMPACMAATGDSGGRLRGLLRTIAAMPASWFYARKLRRAIQQIDPDVIHSNGLKTHLLLSMAKPGAPVVWHLHDFLSSRPLACRMLKRASRRASRAIAISNAVARDAGVLPGLPIDTVLNAIDTERFSPRTDEHSTMNVGLIATYARWKGHDVFLQAASIVRTTRPDLPIRFHIIGSPLYHTGGSQWSLDELQQRARDLSIESHVTFTPFQPDPVPVYHNLDIVVHASIKPEPFGLTIIEAMACGKPVIVSAAGGAAELFTDGHDAIGFTPGNATELAMKIVELATNPKLRNCISLAARQTAAQRFSAARYAPQLVDVYQRAIKHVTS